MNLTTNTTPETTQASISRRSILQSASALVVSFSLASWSELSSAQSTNPPLKSKSNAIDEVEGFIAVNADGSITIYSGKVDLGTGIRTAMTQIACEELDVPLSRVNVIQGDTLTTPDQGPTFGSLSIQIGGMQIRQACATAREALKAQAAKQWGVSPGEIETKDGVCRFADKSLSYVSLVSQQPLSMKSDPKAVLKNPASYSVVGKSIPRLDIPAKLTGEFTYIHDFKLPGMLHARVVRPPALHANLLSFDDAKVKTIPGFVQTVRDGDFLAVVCTDEWAAIKASKAMLPMITSWS